VVDFLVVGFGPMRWPVFNLADVGVTTGALLLVLYLWDDAEPGSQAAPE
jgi:lipoprotein signal peptidase